MGNIRGRWAPGNKVTQSIEGLVYTTIIKAVFTEVVGDWNIGDEVMDLELEENMIRHW